MSEQKGFRRDEERLKAIRRNQKEMRPPEGFNSEESIKKMTARCEPIFKAQIAFHRFLRDIVEQGHLDMGMWKRYKLMRSLSLPYELWQHIQECQECKPVLKESLRQVEIFSKMTLIPPRIVTREDGEKAIEHLARINNMTEEDFKKWIHETGDRIVKEMNKAGR